MSNSNSALEHDRRARYQHIVARLEILNGSRFVNGLNILDPKFEDKLFEIQRVIQKIT
jgi:hypothetical protein